MRTPTGPQRLSSVGLLLIAALVVTLSGCGGRGGGGGGGGDAASTTTTTDTTSTTSTDQPATDDAPVSDSSPKEPSSKLPDPCKLVSLEIASEILGSQSAAPEPGGVTATGNTTSCSWQSQESKDKPTLDNVGHVLTLSVFGSPSPSMTTKDLYDSIKSSGDGVTPAEVTGCTDAFWSGGMLNALKDDVYISATAGLADESPAAKAGASKLIEAACASLG